MIQTLLFVAGINTLCQSFFGTRLPAVMGGSYTIVAPTISIIMAGRYSNEADPREVVEFSGNLPPSSRPLFQFLGYSSQGAALLTRVQKFLRTMRGTQGALIIASTIQIVLGFSGLWRNVVK